MECKPVLNLSLRKPFGRKLFDIYICKCLRLLSVESSAEAKKQNFSAEKDAGHLFSDIVLYTHIHSCETDPSFKTPNFKTQGNF